MKVALPNVSISNISLSKFFRQLEVWQELGTPCPIYLGEYREAIII
jgi:hypothetical protein